MISVITEKKMCLDVCLCLCGKVKCRLLIYVSVCVCVCVAVSGGSLMNSTCLIVECTLRPDMFIITQFIEELAKEVGLGSERKEQPPPCAFLSRFLI